MLTTILSFARGVEGTNNHITVSIEGTQDEILLEKKYLDTIEVRNGQVVTSFHIKSYSDNQLLMRCWDADQKLFNTLIERGYKLASGHKN